LYNLFKKVVLDYVLTI